MRGHPLDADLLAWTQADRRGRLRVWEPEAAAVVLGRSNRAEREADLAACRRDGVLVLRRRGGGGAVVLAPGCLVVSLARPVARPLAVGTHLGAAVSALSEAVRAAAGVALAARGSGDLCVGDRKVLGSSAFCGRGVFFYQASLLVDPDLELVARYLRYPSREPAYRRGRAHGEFLTTLRRAGYGGSAAALAPALARCLADRAGAAVVTSAAAGV